MRRTGVALVVLLMAATVVLHPITSAGGATTTVDLVPLDATWAYDDTGTPRPADGAWTSLDTSGWTTGTGQFGYGDGDETTTVSYGDDPSRKHVTTYFLTTFDVTDPTTVTDLDLHLLRDDGAVTYLNGTEIDRTNIDPTTTVNWWTFATTWNTPEDTFTTTPVDPALLVTGTNTLAVSVHQAFRASADLSFHARLSAVIDDDVPPPPPPPPGPTAFVPLDATWAYDDTGTPRPADGAWTSLDTSGWTTGTGQFGYGDGDETTTVSYGDDPSRKHVTTYFLTTFDVTDPTTVTDLDLHLLRDDGAVTYLNGTEIDRTNIDPTTTVNWWTFATTWNTPEDTFTTTPVDPALLVTGTNTLAVSVHQAFRASADLSFHAELTGTIDGPPADDATLWAVGDIANCSRTQDEAVAAMLDGTTGAIALLGDIAYPDGSADDFADCFLPAWGGLLPRAHATPGNHEYYSPQAGPYFDVFADTPTGTPAPGYYSYDAGAWRVVVLNSNCDYSSVGGCDADSPQYAWLQSVLLDAPECLLAYSHHPFRTSTTRIWDEHLPLIGLLDAAGMDIYLSGHAHGYERFAPMDASGAADPDGFRSFVVATGGVPSYDFESPPVATSEVRQKDSFGALELTLSDGGYAWDFALAIGEPFADSGTGSCTG